MIVLIDGDPPVYSCGFAANDDPVEHALHNMKQLINKICEATQADEYKIYLTGKNNYRNDMVDYYKANRDSSHKPLHYEALRNYLVEVHDAEVVDGMEADDALGIAQYQSYIRGVETCIATIDKDLLMIPGKHYNWNKDVLHEVDEFKGIEFFYTQLLTGDKVDNIKGIHGIGPKKAEKILDGATTELELYRRVQMEYEKYKGDFYQGFDYMCENAHLLWIKRHPDELWRPPNES